MAGRRNQSTRIGDACDSVHRILQYHVRYQYARNNLLLSLLSPRDIWPARRSHTAERRLLDCQYWQFVKHHRTEKWSGLRKASHLQCSLQYLTCVLSMVSKAASKHALVGFSKSIAIEYATSHVRVNVVAPGTPRLSSMVCSDADFHSLLREFRVHRHALVS